MEAGASLVFLVGSIGADIFAQERFRRCGNKAASAKSLGRTYKKQGFANWLHFNILDSDLGDFGEEFGGDY